MDASQIGPTGFQDHRLRYELANELHARPFPSVDAPAHAVFLAIKRPENAASRDRDADRAHLEKLLDRFGADHPAPGATHFFGALGKHRLKWESHTEFVTYMILVDGLMARPFDGAAFDVFPEDWLAEAPGVRVTSILIRIENPATDAKIAKALGDWFVPESLAVSRVLDDGLVVAGDFRIDASGHTRFAIWPSKGTGPSRIGRVVQRLTEIETYKSMSMLGLARARALSRELGPLDERVTGLVSDMGAVSEPETTLAGLLEISAALEGHLARSSFRFGATGAYEALVNQRIEVLREERFGGRQTLSEFMLRRFDPAMRTVKAAEGRLKAMAERATRAANLLQTRVDVDRSAQNQRLLESMDKRADLQLRLQKTVEGLSVVAISYYAVNLVIYVLGPVGHEVGVSKLLLTAVVTPLVILGVWGMVRRIRKGME